MEWAEKLFVRSGDYTCLAVYINAVLYYIFHAAFLKGRVKVFVIW